MMKFSSLNYQEKEEVTNFNPTNHFIYEPQMTLEDYIQAKNVQRKMQYKLLNLQYGGSNPLSQQKQFLFEKQLHDIKGFIFHIIGQGSLYNKFVIMIENLYVAFMKEITVYHQLKTKKQTQTKDARFQEFKKSNEQIAQYLKNVQKEHNQIDKKLENLKKAKQMYKINREKQIQERLKKQKKREELLRKQIEQKFLKEKQKYLLALQQQKKEQKKPQPVALQVEPKKKPQIKKTQKEIQQYNQRRLTIGKLSNIFASFIED